MTEQNGESFRSRLGRRQSSRLDPAIPTEEDKENIAEFAQRLEAAVALLKREIEAIGAGQLEAVTELYERKSRLLKWIELRMPVIEPFLGHETAKEARITESLQELRDVAREDSVLLERMAVAARTIVREMDKALDRNSLSGMYGKSGQKLVEEREPRKSINREY